jgi:two-component system, cell cycle sensor histidine kinase and response regulator CckA
MAERDRAGTGLVLVVDHDLLGRRALRHVLSQWGFDVVQAASGIVALELIQRLPGRFRFIIVDLDLPGLPGGAVVETLLHFRPDLPVLCVSAARVAAAPGAGAGCLSKPLEADELETQVRAALEGQAVRWVGHPGVSPEVLAEVRARFAATGDLGEAALRLAREMAED